jgi:hypothetical protein
VGTIPSDGRLVTSSINQGVDFLSSKSAASANVSQIAALIAQPRIVKLQRSDHKEMLSADTAQGRTRR